MHGQFSPEVIYRTLKLSGVEGQKQNKTKQKAKPKSLSRKPIYKEESFSAILRYQKDKTPGSQLMLTTFWDRGKSEVD